MQTHLKASVAQATAFRAPVVALDDVIEGSSVCLVKDLVQQRVQEADDGTVVLHAVRCRTKPVKACQQSHTGNSERRKTQQHQLFMPVVAAAAAAAAAADDMGDARNTQVKTWAAIGGPGRGHRTVGCRVDG